MMARRMLELDCKELLWSLSATVMVDIDGIILATSRPFEGLFGYLQGELIGKSLDLLLSPESQTKHGEYIKRFCTGMGLSPAPMTTRPSISAVRKDGTELQIVVIVATAFLEKDQQVAVAMIGELPTKSALVSATGHAA